MGTLFQKEAWYFQIFGDLVSVHHVFGTLMNLYRHMLHDPTRYHDPFKFDPARFLGKNPEPDPTDVCFGFGRR
jgi:hypothetical protein